MNDIKWPDFNLFSSNTVQNLSNDTDFTDVTLVTCDDQQIKAHKVILSSCSAFFKNILIKNPHPNTLLYLKNINHQSLKSVLNFVYLGQCEVPDDKVTELFYTGNELKIDGLTTQYTTQYNQGNNKVTYDEHIDYNKSEEVVGTHENSMMTSSQKIPYQNTYVNKESDKIKVIEANIKELDTFTDETDRNDITHNIGGKANSGFSESQKNRSINDHDSDTCKDNTSLFHCDLCEDIYSEEKEMLDHKNMKHPYTTASESIPRQQDKIRPLEKDIMELENFSDEPEINEISENSLPNKENNEYSKLIIHKSENIHDTESVTKKCDTADSSTPHTSLFRCDLCENIFNEEKEMLIHKNIKHQYPKRKWIESKTWTNIKKLKARNILEVDKNLRYECSLCKANYSNKKSLFYHKRSIHDGITIDCDNCDKTFNSLSSLHNHRMFEHEGRCVQCPNCPKTYPNLTVLRRHSKVHTKKASR